MLASKDSALSSGGDGLLGLDNFFLSREEISATVGLSILVEPVLLLEVLRPLLPPKRLGRLVPRWTDASEP